MKTKLILWSILLIAGWQFGTWLDQLRERVAAVQQVAVEGVS